MKNQMFKPIKALAVLLLLGALNLQAGETTMILMKTTKGDIKIELDAAKAPKTVANFLKYVESGHYSNTIFHRVINNFMIQGGGMTANMAQKKAPDTVENEANNGLKNLRGTIAMARTSDPTCAAPSRWPAHRIRTVPARSSSSTSSTTASSTSNRPLSKAGATVSSAKSSKAWMSLMPSKAFRQLPAMFPKKPSLSPKSP